MPAQRLVSATLSKERLFAPHHFRLARFGLVARARFFVCITSKWPNHHTIMNSTEVIDMLDLTSSAKYLGISRGRFRGFAPKPDAVVGGVYPQWRKSTLDAIDTTPLFCHETLFRQGKECGERLLGELPHEEVTALRAELIWCHSPDKRFIHVCGAPED